MEFYESCAPGAASNDADLCMHESIGYPLEEKLYIGPCDRIVLIAHSIRRG